MNKWKVIRVKEDLYMLLKQQADQEGRSLANYTDSLLREVVSKNEQ